MPFNLHVWCVPCVPGFRASQQITNLMKEVRGGPRARHTSLATRSVSQPARESADHPEPARHTNTLAATQNTDLGHVGPRVVLACACSVYATSTPTSHCVSLCLFGLRHIYTDKSLC
ncbi:hypothetical protein DPEC_G00016430 [Dallia pectoralis]|uniref:Uncharacterized protein n=1 Tax=Dallia pectoralis TaxID=75939 RepID=A0ACC2HNA0_DALPE|nr:hypothetical protein DPEC_G00016430 [Dallia pectoralis]